MENKVYLDSLFCSSNNFDITNYKINEDKIYCLNIVNDFFDNNNKLSNLPKNIIKIYIDSKFYNLDYFDPHIILYIGCWIGTRLSWCNRTCCK